MSEAATTTTELFGSDGDIGVDHPCKRCGYNLRGLRQAGRCPECGTPVGFSPMGDQLRFSNPDWVSGVARGLRIVLWTLLLSFILCVAEALSTSLGTDINPLLSAGCGFALSLSTCYGVWLITKPDPGRVAADSISMVRRLARATAVAGLGAAPLSLLWRVPALPAAAEFAGIAAMLALGLVVIVGEYAKFVLYERFARRIPNVTLAWRARLLRWPYVMVLTLVSAESWIDYLLARGASSAAGLATVPAGLGCVLWLLAAMYCGASLGALDLLRRLRRAVAEQGRLAREAWAAAPDVGANKAGE